MKKYSWNVRGNERQLMKRGKPITQKSLKKLNRRSKNKVTRSAPQQSVPSTVGIRPPELRPSNGQVFANPNLLRDGNSMRPISTKPLLQKNVGFKRPVDPNMRYITPIQPITRAWL